MNDTPTLASSQGTPGGRADVARRRCSLETLPGIVATWGERLRLRRDLQQKLKCSPHLIDDIGLTRRQVEVEIAKPFWRP